MKSIFKVCALMLLITFSSCNEDLYESQIQQNEGKFQIRELSKSEIELNPKLSQELNQIQNFKSKIVANKMVYDPVYDFFVNTDEALFISDGVSESYTFPVYRATSNTVVENLVIHIQNQLTLVFLVDYGYSLNQLKNMTKTQLEQNDVKHYLIDFNTNSILNGKLDVPHKEHICVEDYVWDDSIPCNQGDLVGAGQGIYCGGWVLQSSVCQWITTGGGGGTTDSGTSGTGTTGSGPTGGSTNTGSNVYDSVTINTIFVGCSTCPEFTLGLSNFLSTLSVDQFAFWESTRLDFITKRSIISYLEQNNYSSESMAFVKESLIALNEGGEVDFNNQVILDSSFVNSLKIKCLYDKLVNSPNNNLFKNMLNLFSNSTNKFIRFSVGNTQGDFGITNGNSNIPYDYNIIIDNSMESFSNLANITTLCHELIHAYMFSSLEDGGYVTFDSNGQPSLIGNINCNNYSYIFSIQNFIYNLKLSSILSQRGLEK